MTDQRHFATSGDLCRHIADLSGDTALVSFSCGKDAVTMSFRPNGPRTYDPRSLRLTMPDGTVFTGDMLCRA